VGKQINRVRCDLKDLPFSSTGTQPQCSNCKERGLKCVSVLFSNIEPSSYITHPRLACSDEFAEVKAVKLLRRGRRLQQVECVPPPIPLSFLCSTVRTGPSMANLSMRRAVSLPLPPCRRGSFPSPSPNFSHPHSSADSTSSVSRVQACHLPALHAYLSLSLCRSYH
jgi:Fungal Zn(2)-Cys(6) binuclear cluster domain